MKVRYKFAAASSALLLLAFGLLYSTRSVSAAAEGKITGTIKLDGTAPHQKPIDMSKEPTCAKEHASKPVTTETVVVGPSGGLEWVVVYIFRGPAGRRSQPGASGDPKVGPKELSIHSTCDGARCEPALPGDQQRSTLSQHPPHSETWRTQSRVEQVAADGGSAIRRGMDRRGSRDTGQVQHPPLDARLYGRGQGPNGRER